MQKRKLLAIKHEMRKIEQSYHLKAYFNIKQLGLISSTFEDNHSSFVQHLKALNTDETIDDFRQSKILVKASPLKWEYDAIEKEIYRLLLNFVASAMALIDHTRNMVNDLYGRSIQAEPINMLSSLLIRFIGVKRLKRL